MDNALHGVSESLGLDVSATKFFASIVAGYLFAFIYLLFPRGSKTLSHSYFGVCGLLTAYFCFGYECVYHLISILVSYLSLQLIGTGFYNVVFTFVFQMSYLVGAYIFYASAGYDINWTTPQCMLCLKLIGLAWDCYDGQQKEEKLRAYQLETRYEGTPRFLEVIGFSYFFGGFFTGPYFSFTRYVKFAEGTLIDENADHKARIYFVGKKLVAGLFPLLIYVCFNATFSCEYFFTSEFKEKSFFMKCTLITITYHINFCKYVFSWAFAETICVIAGIAYNGTKDGVSRWNALTSFKYRKFLFGPFFQDVLEGFNLPTSHWCGKYVFRRLAFLGSKTVSHILAMVFLAIWHGFYIGYFICFGMEFVFLFCERKLCENLRILSGKSYLELSFPLRLLIRVLGFTYRAYVCGFCAASFILLTWERVTTVYSEVYYWGFLAALFEMLLIVITGQLVRFIGVRKEKEN